MDETSPNIPRLYELVTVDNTDSARAHAERLADSGAEEGVLVWAKKQQAGVGRHGNYWMSGERNLHCALVLRPENSFAECCQLSLIATICAALAISPQAEPLEEFLYRWPNDVLLNRGKVAGVTLSGKLSATQVDWVVLGVNVNVFEAPESKGFVGASMRGEGFQSFDRVRVLETFSREFLSWINRWAELGFAPVHRAWTTRGIYSQPTTSIRSLGQEFTGVTTELKMDGSIILSQDQQQKELTLTDFFGPDFR